MMAMPSRASVDIIMAGSSPSNSSNLTWKLEMATTLYRFFILQSQQY
jgi:hypothetical protein